MAAKQKTPFRSPDTIFSDDTLEVILGLGEGPYNGLKNGGRSAYFGDTPLLDSTGRPNVGNFDLKVYKGSNPGEVIRPNLGGSGSATAVGVSLTEYNQEVVRRGTKTNIDFIDIRLSVNVLRYVALNGDDLPSNLSSFIQVKRESQTWDDAISVGMAGGNSNTSTQTRTRLTPRFMHKLTPRLVLALALSGSIPPPRMVILKSTMALHGSIRRLVLARLWVITTSGRLWTIRMWSAQLTGHRLAVFHLSH